MAAIRNTLQDIVSTVANVVMLPFRALSRLIGGGRRGGGSRSGRA